jgi:ABC-type phosphate transport system substrate-binding protein
MKTLLWCGLLSTLLSTAQAAQTQRKKVVVIVNAANPATALSLEQARDCFLKKHGSWKAPLADLADLAGFDANEKIRPIDLPEGHPERSVFLHKVLGMSSASLSRHWVKLQYQSAAEPATQVDSAARLIRLVGESRGAIGFADEGALDAEARKKVKVVLTLDYD